MEREEAIGYLLGEYVVVHEGNEYEKELNEALDMAIEALSKPNYESDNEVRLAVTDRNKDKVVLWDAFGEVEYYPTVQADRPHGEWILECDAEGEDDNLYRCSECGCNYGCQEYDIPNFCPNCGADMRKEKE